MPKGVAYYFLNPAPMIFRLVDSLFFPSNSELSLYLALQIESYYTVPGKSRIVTIWIKTISFLFSEE